MYVCICNAVTERQVKEAIDAGADSAEALAECLGVSTCCGSCRPTVDAVLSEHAEPAAVPLAALPGARCAPALNAA